MSAHVPRGKRLSRVRWALGALLLAFPSSLALAQESADCLACHGEKDFTTERKGRTVSLYVSGRAYGASIHGSLACISCHADVQGMEGAHEAPLQKVDCGSCHEAETKQHTASLHGAAMKRGDSLAPTCGACHGIHDIRAVKDPAAPVAPLNVCQ